MKFTVSVVQVGFSEPEQTEVEADDVAGVLEEIAPNFVGAEGGIKLRIAESVNEDDEPEAA